MQTVSIFSSQELYIDPYLVIRRCHPNYGKVIAFEYYVLILVCFEKAI